MAKHLILIFMFKMQLQTLFVILLYYFLVVDRIIIDQFYIDIIIW